METQATRDRLAALAEDRAAEEVIFLEEERQDAAEEARRRGCPFFAELPDHGYSYHRAYLRALRVGGLVFRARAGAGEIVGYNVE